MDRQLPVLESLRGIAACCILLHHLTVYLFPGLAHSCEGITPFFQKNYLWVDFFFILSGFVASHAHFHQFNSKVQINDYIVYLGKRFFRLYPLHLVLLAAFVLMEVIYYYIYTHISLPTHGLPQPFHNEFSVKTLFLNLIFLQGLLPWDSWNSPAWAISDIWLVAFIIPFSMTFLQKRNITSIILVIIFSLTLLFLIDRNRGSLDFMGWQGLLRCLAETTIGIALYSLRDFFPRQCSENGFRIFFYALVLLSLISLALPINHVATVLLFPALILAGSFIRSDPLFTHSALLSAGKFSFSLYMIHWLFLKGLDKTSLLFSGVALHRHGNMGQHIVLSLFFFTAMLPLSSFTYKYIEIPLRNLTSVTIRDLLKRSPGEQ